MGIFDKFTVNKQQPLVDEELERGTFYVRPEHQYDLDELRLKLMRNNVRTNKSELVRVAIDNLVNQNIKDVKKLLSKKRV